MSILLVSAKELRLDRDVCNRLKWKRTFQINSKICDSSGGWMVNKLPNNFLTYALNLWHMS